MRRLEQLRARRAYNAISEDGFHSLLDAWILMTQILICLHLVNRGFEMTHLHQNLNRSLHILPEITSICHLHNRTWTMICLHLINGGFEMIALHQNLEWSFHLICHLQGRGCHIPPAWILICLHLVDVVYWQTMIGGTLTFLLLDGVVMVLHIKMTSMLPWGQTFHPQGKAGRVLEDLGHLTFPLHADTQLKPMLYMHLCFLTFLHQGKATRKLLWKNNEKQVWFLAKIWGKRLLELRRMICWGKQLH